MICFNTVITNICSFSVLYVSWFLFHLTASLPVYVSSYTEISQFFEGTKMIRILVLLSPLLQTITFTFAQVSSSLCTRHLSSAISKQHSDLTQPSDTFDTEKASLCLYSFITVRCLCFSTFCTPSSFLFQHDTEGILLLNDPVNISQPEFWNLTSVFYN